MKLSVIIQTYNGGKIILSTLESVCGYLSRQTYDWEVLIVNDGSKDDTATVVTNFMHNDGRFKLLDNKINHGKGWVVKQGMAEAKADWRLFMDDDSSTPIETVEKLWPHTEENYDVIIASIAVKGAKVSRVEKFHRRLFGKIGNLWIQFWVLPGIWDSQRGFKMFSAKAAETIFPKLKITRWGFDIEVLALARKFKFKIKEVPINWNNSGPSRVKLSAYIQVLLEVLKIRWNLWTNKYK
jgi:dolichyl-phosphate beta-glucosyltransferase